MALNTGGISKEKQDPNTCPKYPVKSCFLSLERTISHTSTRVDTGAKVAARKIRGGRVRGMRVLAYMNTAKWGSMDTSDIEEAIQCPCECAIQNVEHVIS